MTSKQEVQIYFAGSIRGGRQDVDLYLALIERLQQEHGNVLTEHVGTSTLSASGEVSMTEAEIHDRDVKWLKSSDIIVAEVTQPSLGVGYELGLASSIGKPCLCLFRPDQGRSLSAMIRGCPEFHVREYKSENDAAKIFREEIPRLLRQQ